MSQSKIKIVIHHHHLVYKDAAGKLWLSSVIGRWVDALADDFSEIGLLLYQSDLHLPSQDTLITKGNIKLYSLGKRTTFWKGFSNRKIQKGVCLEASKYFDLLLIRGVTPHQFKIWRNTPLKHKAFLLVGSLAKKNTVFPRSILDMIDRILRIIRFHELKYMANRDILMLANSRNTIEEIGQSFSVKAFFVPTNSLRENEFAPFQIRPVTNQWKILYCGRLDVKKGLRELFQAINLLQAQGRQCHLDIVGSTQNPVYHELLELASDLGIKNMVNWHGLVPYGEDLLKFYRSADVMVLPSYTEGFPHAIWEAMASCCPVIATSVGGIPSLIINEVHALLIEAKNPKSIVDAVDRVLIDADFRSILIKQAYEYSKSFSVEACSKELKRILEQNFNL